VHAATGGEGSNLGCLVGIEVMDGVGKPGAGLDLNGDARPTDLGHQVELTPTDAPVPADDRRTAVFEKAGGDVLPQ
jgi:hypothetical protein